MKITDMMLSDIRAEIEYKDEKIIVRNAKGDLRLSLLNKLNEKLMNDSGFEDINLDDLELMEILLKELTNIEIDDSDDVRTILQCPNEELTRVSFYLAAILQELMFEVIASKNLMLRNQEFLLLQNDTLACVDRAETMIDEIIQRSGIRVLNKEDDERMAVESATPDNDVVQLHGENDGKNIQ